MAARLMRVDWRRPRTPRFDAMAHGLDLIHDGGPSHISGRPREAPHYRPLASQVIHSPSGEDINSRFSTDLSDHEWGQGYSDIRIFKPASRRE